MVLPGSLKYLKFATSMHAATVGIGAIIIKINALDEYVSSFHQYSYVTDRLEYNCLLMLSVHRSRTSIRYSRIAYRPAELARTLNSWFQGYRNRRNRSGDVRTLEQKVLWLFSDKIFRYKFSDSSKV